MHVLCIRKLHWMTSSGDQWICSPIQVQGFAASGAGGPSGPVQPPSLRQAFSAIVRSEGLAALWKGNGATIVHRLPYSAINFWAYERLTVQLQTR